MCSEHPCELRWLLCLPKGFTVNLHQAESLWLLLELYKVQRNLILEQCVLKPREKQGKGEI